jgi:hypothetical protein
VGEQPRLKSESVSSGSTISRTISLSGGAAERCLLIISPPACYEPAAIVAGRRLWGVAVQLYTLRSQVNWGIGDFGGLKRLIRWMGSCAQFRYFLPVKEGSPFLALGQLDALKRSGSCRSFRCEYL